MIHLDQKVKGKVAFVNLKSTQLQIPSEKRQTLSHQVARATNGIRRNLVSLKESSIKEVGKSQDWTKLLQVKENGASESYAVMA